MRSPADYLAATRTDPAEGQVLPIADALAAVALALEDARAEKYRLLLTRAVRNAKKPTE